MKKQILKFIAFAVLVTAISSCSVEYREHRGHWDHDHEHYDRH